MGDPKSVMSKHDEDVQQLETHGWHDEEVDRRNVADVILEERPPRPRRQFAMAAAYRTEPLAVGANADNTKENEHSRDDATPCDYTGSSKLGAAGFEPA